MTDARRNCIQLGVLGLAIAGLGVVAWRSEGALDELQRARDRLAAELTSLNSRKSMALAAVQNVETKHRERTRASHVGAIWTSQEAVTHAMERKIEEMKATMASNPPTKTPPQPGGPMGNRLFPELFGDPVYAALARKFLEVKIERRDGPFLSKLRASPDKWEKVREFLVDQEMESWREAETQPIGTQLNAISEGAAFEASRSIQSFEFRQTVARFVERLSYSSLDPLSREQENRLVELMMSIPALSFTREVVERAQTVLSPEQAEALRKFAGVK
jgi:hypothetical protein